MAKVKIGSQRFTYLMPTILVGANTDGKPSFTAIASCGEACGDPPTLSVAIRHLRYIDTGIRQNMTFSVNIPSADMMKQTDYCGIVSGKNVNKAEVCGFKIFYGKLGNTPLIEGCPVNMECKVSHILDLGSHSLFIGRIEEVHSEEEFLSDGKLDIEKIMPFIFSMAPSPQYYSLGNAIARAFSIGKELDKKQS